MINEIQRYLNEEGIGMAQVKENLTELIDNPSYDIPVCILSHMYDPKRSKMLVELMKEELDRRYIIFTYEDQKDLYQQFENKKNLEVHYIPLEKEYLTLSGKRQYILEFLQKEKYNNGFFIEDDCFNFYLPIGAIGDNGNFRNKKFMMTFSLTFALWEHLIHKYDLTYSGPVNNMEFTFRNLDEHPFIKKNAQVVQAIHINVKKCKELDINYDHDAGWDDYDMILQQVTKNIGTQGIIFSYVTPALKSGVSAMSSSADALAKRCEANTTKLINKWGLSLVREDTKKGLYNAKINWHNIRLANKHEVQPREIIGLTNEEAKSYIKNKNNLIGEW